MTRLVGHDDRLEATWRDAGPDGTDADGVEATDVAIPTEGVPSREATP